MSIPPSAYYAIARAASAITGIVAVPVYVALVPTDEYGRYALAIAVAGVANAILFHWIPAATARIYPLYLEAPGGLLRIILRLWIREFALLLLVAAVLMVYIPQTVRGMALAAIGYLVSLSLYQLALEVARSELRPDVYAKAVMAYAVASIAAGSLMAYNGLGASAPFLGLAVGQSVGVLLVKRAGLLPVDARDQGGDPRQVMRQMLSYGGPMAVALVLSMLMPTVDRYLVRHSFGLGAVAAYSATYAAAFPTVTALASVVNLSGYTNIIRAHEAGADVKLNALLRRQLTLLLAMLLPIVVGSCLVRAQLLNLVPEGPYTQGVDVLPLILSAAMMNSIRGNYVDLSHHLSRRVGWIVVAMIAAIVCMGAVGSRLIPQFGILGAAGALVLSYFCAIAVSFGGALTQRRLPLPHLRHAVALVFALAGMCVASQAISMSGHVGGRSFCAWSGPQAAYLACGALALRLLAGRSGRWWPR